MNSYEGENSAGQGNLPAVRIAVVEGALPEDWRTIYDRLSDSLANRPARTYLKLAAGVATLAGLFIVSGLLTLISLYFMPDVSPVFLAIGVVLPGLLGGAAAGQAGGNLFLRLWTGLDDATRRGFATRLSLGRCPHTWPAPLRRWLFTGDWLGTPTYDLRLPYVRIFVKGAAPATCRDEDAIWREIHGNIAGDSLWEAGTNIREISYPSMLPSWAREVANGDGYSDLKKRIGYEEADAWVMHLWRRACRQWPALGANDYPEKARRECFEMHSLHLSGDREALVVVLRPVTFVNELAEEKMADDNSIAA